MGTVIPICLNYSRVNDLPLSPHKTSSSANTILSPFSKLPTPKTRRYSLSYRYCVGIFPFVRNSLYTHASLGNLSQFRREAPHPRYDTTPTR